MRMGKYQMSKSRVAITVRKIGRLQRIKITTAREAGSRYMDYLEY